MAQRLTRRSFARIVPGGVVGGEKRKAEKVRCAHDVLYRGPSCHAGRHTAEKARGAGCPVPRRNAQRRHL
jgi:hypothetical protein